MCDKNVSMKCLTTSALISTIIKFHGLFDRFKLKNNVSMYLLSIDLNNSKGLHATSERIKELYRIAVSNGGSISIFFNSCIVYKSIIFNQGIQNACYFKWINLLLF